nr:hypothetical protein [Tanacetum cinerariifolium]
MDQMGTPTQYWNDQIVGLKSYRDPKEEPIEKEPLMELKEIGYEECHLHGPQEPSTYIGSEGVEYASKEPGVRGMILAAQGEAFKQENVLAERLHGLDQQMERKEDESLYFIDRRWVSLMGGIEMDGLHHVAGKQCKKSFKDAIGYEYSLSSSNGWTNIVWKECRSPVLWTDIGENSLIGPELVGDRVLLNVSPWKGMIRFGKKGKLALSVHDTFYVSNLKKCLADANLHVPLDEIKIDKTLHFVEELVEIIDHEVRSLKRSKISLMKVCWNSKRRDFLKEGYCDNRDLSSQASVRDSSSCWEKAHISSRSRSKRVEGKNQLMKAVHSSSHVLIVPSLSLSSHVFASPSNNTVGSLHRFIIHGIVISKNIKEVTEVIDVDNWRIDNSRVLRWIVSLIEGNSYVSSTKSTI